MFTLTERLWYTADKTAVVSDGDLKAAFLLGVEGSQISDEEATRLGLSETKAEPKKRANKKAKAPANKSKK